MRLRLSLFLLFGAFYTGFSQSCDALIAEYKIIGGAHLLRSHPATLVVRGSYTYSLELMSSDKGITAKIYSKGGVEFNQDDELIFMDINQNRRSFRFVEMGEMNMDRGTPIHMNVVQLDLKAVQWFATSDLLVLYIKNNINKEMRKFTVNTSRQQEFRQLAVCFNEKLDKSKVVDVELPENPAPKSDPSKPVSATTSSTPTAAKRNVDPSQMTDEELADLRRELHDVKDKLKEEIAAERERANQIKQSIQEEVASAREQAANQKKVYADEVLEARKKARDEIEKSHQASAAEVQEARQKAESEKERISLDVADARQRANDAIKNAQLESAQEVYSMRPYRSFKKLSRVLTQAPRPISRRCQWRKTSYVQAGAMKRQTDNLP